MTRTCVAVLSLLIIAGVRLISSTELPRISCRRTQAASILDCSETDIIKNETRSCMYRSSRQLTGKALIATQPLINQINFYWTGLITIGTPGVTFLIDFDTGSSDLWVPSSRCVSTCKNKMKYNSGASNTSQINGAQFRIRYGDESYATGFFTNDIVTVAALSVVNQPFAEATNMSSSFDEQLMDGILGLAYPTIATRGQTPFFYNMWAQGLISQPIFSFYFNPDPTVYPGGELILGGVDTSKYTGSITYVNVNLQGYWEFTMGGVTVGNTTVCSNCRAIADTGTTLIIGPRSQVVLLNAILGGTYDRSIGLYMIDCQKRTLSSLPDVVFSIGNRTFTIIPLQYLLIFKHNNQSTCYSAFQGANIPDFDGQPLWILGDYFLSRFYSVYDIQLNRVGFAKSVSYNVLQEFQQSSIKNSALTNRPMAPFFSLILLILAFRLSREKCPENTSFV